MTLSHLPPPLFWEFRRSRNMSFINSGLINNLRANERIKINNYYYGKNINKLKY